MKYTDFAEQRLKEAGYRVTKPRHLVLQALSKDAVAQNPYEICRVIGAQGFSIDVSTVYRILEVFKKLKLVHFVKEQQGYLACQDYDCCEAKHCHHQFVCKKCEKVSEIHVDDSTFIEKLKKNFSELIFEGHYFEFSGICKKCFKK